MNYYSIVAMLSVHSLILLLYLTGFALMLYNTKMKMDRPSILLSSFYLVQFVMYVGMTSVLYTQGQGDIMRVDLFYYKSPAA